MATVVDIRDLGIAYGNGPLVLSGFSATLPEHSLPTGWPASTCVVGTVISRDNGEHWTRIPLQEGDNGFNMEGGGIQLRDGSILALETYIQGNGKPNEAIGQLYFSNDDWHTLQGPVPVTLHIPGIIFHGSSDDGGNVSHTARFHRRILELPNGDLLTTVYGRTEHDVTPSPYMPTMMKCRVVLVRSTNRGRHWEQVSTVAADPAIGTEGFDEAVIGRINHGPHTGRLICKMRTGQEQREAISDDEGKTWSHPYARIYAGIDVYQTDKWAAMFQGVKDHHGKPVVGNPAEMVGAVVDPDLVVLRSGILVTSFGVRIPPRACWPRAGYPANGSYIAISLDQGATWSHVIQMTSGVLTTHYTAIEEGPDNNHLFFAYDLGDWTSGHGRAIYGRTVAISVK